MVSQHATRYPMGPVPAPQNSFTPCLHSLPSIYLRSSLLWGEELLSRTFKVYTVSQHQMNLALVLYRVNIL